MMEFSLPQILSRVSTQAYNPKLAGAVDTMLNTDSNIEYRMAKKVATIEITGYQNINLYDDKQYPVGQFGLPVYMPLLMQKVEGTDGDLLLDSAIVSVNRVKRVQVTETLNRRNSTKEHITNGDYLITVSGILATTGADYPKQQHKQLQKFLDVTTPIPIVHEILNMKGIYEIVITSDGIEPSPYRNIQPYSFSAIDESPNIIKRRRK